MALRKEADELARVEREVARLRPTAHQFQEEEAERNVDLALRNLRQRKELILLMPFLLIVL